MYSMTFQFVSMFCKWFYCLARVNLHRKWVLGSSFLVHLMSYFRNAFILTDTPGGFDEPKPRPIRFLRSERYDTIVDLVLGRFRIPHKQRNREQQNAYLQHWRNKDKFEVENGVLYHMGQKVYRHWCIHNPGCSGSYDFLNSFVVDGNIYGFFRVYRYFSIFMVDRDKYVSAVDFIQIRTWQYLWFCWGKTIGYAVVVVCDGCPSSFSVRLSKSVGVLIYAIDTNHDTRLW